MKKKSTEPLEQYKPRKEILYDIDLNKYYLKYENNSKLFNSNIFGANTPQTFSSPKKLGSYKERVLSHSMDKINFKVDKSLYRPQSKRFEGYTQFARPLVVPFTNISQSKSRKYLYENIDKIKNVFLTPKNKSIVSKKLNQGLEFYTGTINNITDNKNKKIVIKKIDECLVEEQKAKEYNRGKTMEDGELRALRNIKKKLMTNSTNVIFGRKLKQPDKKFIQKFKINYNIYFRNPVKKFNTLQTDKKDYFKSLYETLNKEEVKQNLSFMNNKTSINNNVTKLIKSKMKNNRYILSAHKPGNKSQTRETRETNLFDDKDIKKNLHEQSKDLIDNINSIPKDYLDNLKKQKENYFSHIENKSITHYKHLFTKEIEEEKMFHSIDDISHINFDNGKIHFINNMNKKYESEKKLLVGYIKPEVKEEVTFRKGIVKFKSFLDTYKKELELYKMVNPIQYKISEEKEQKEIKYLKKNLNKKRGISSAYSSKKKDG